MQRLLLDAVHLAEPTTHGQTGILLWGPVVGVALLVVAIRLLFGKKRR